MPRILGILLRASVALAIMLALVFLADYCALRLRKDQFSSVTVRPYLAVPRKDGRLEFMFQQAQEQSCVNSLFPHFGEEPCWYLRRHTEQRTNL
jgi:hypothetical protein